jgi:hypothetical protein
VQHPERKIRDQRIQGDRRLALKKNPYGKQCYVPRLIMVNRTSIGKQANRLPMDRMLRIKPGVIQWVQGISRPDIVAYHPWGKDEEGNREKKGSMSQGLASAGLVVLGVPRMDEGNKECQQEKGDQAVVFRPHSKPATNSG